MEISLPQVGDVDSPVLRILRTLRGLYLGVYFLTLSFSFFLDFLDLADGALSEL